jgi:hypothetical protein
MRHECLYQKKIFSMQAIFILFGFVLGQEGKCYLKNRPSSQPSTPVTPVPVPVPAPVEQSSGLEGDCINTFNSARAPFGASSVRWDEELARAAGSSATYCANVAQRHTNVVGSQIIFRNVKTCSGGIKGWFYDEQRVNGMHYQIIKNAGHTRVGCAVAHSGAGCISCNFK